MPEGWEPGQVQTPAVGVPDGFTAMPEGWEPEAEPSIAGPLDAVGNIGRGAAERAVSRGVGDAANIGQANTGFTADLIKRGYELFGQEPPQGLEEAARLLGEVFRQGSERAEAVDFGYEEMTSWEDLKEKPLRRFLPFALEQGLISTPDMVAAVTNLPGYAILRSGELAGERAFNKGLEGVTVRELVEAMPAAAASAFLERLGARGMLGLDEAVGTIVTKPAKAAVKEAITEAAQEAVEYGGTTVGTDAPLDLSTLAERMAAGAVAGGPFGGIVRSTTMAAEALTGRQVGTGDDQVEIPAVVVRPQDEVPPEPGTVELAPQEAVERPAGERAPALAPELVDRGTPPPPATPVPALSPEELATLRAAGNSDDMIDVMSREEIERELMIARQSAVTVTQQEVDAAVEYQDRIAPQQAATRPYLQPMPQVPSDERSRTERDARDVEPSSVQDMEQYARQVPQSEQPALPQLRGARDSGRSGVDEFLGFSQGRRGPTDSPTPTGSYRQRRQLRAGQPPLGDQEAASAQYAQEPLADGQRQDQNVDGLGGPDELVTIDDSLPTFARDVGDASSSDASADQRPSIKTTDTVDKRPRRKYDRTNERGIPVLKSGTIKKPPTLIDFLAAKGGIRDQRGELAAMDARVVFVPRAGPLVRAKGMPIDRAREAAEEAGYLGGRDILTVLDQDIRTRDQFADEDAVWADAWRAEQEGAPAAEETADVEAVYDDLERLGYKGERGDEFSRRIAERVVQAGENVDLASEIERAAQNMDFLAGLRPTGETAETIEDAFEQSAQEKADATQPGTPSDRGKGLRAAGQPREEPRPEGEAERGREATPVRGKSRAEARSRESDQRRPRQGKPERQPERQPEVATEPGAEGRPQAVIPGAERVPDREMAERRADAPKRASVPQQEPGGLFSDQKDQTDLVDMARAKPKAEKPASRLTASWVIKRKSDGEIIMETFDRKKVDALNTDKYEAVPIGEHLANLNRKPASDDFDPDRDVPAFLRKEKVYQPARGLSAGRRSYTPQQKEVLKKLSEYRETGEPGGQRVSVILPSGQEVGDYIPSHDLLLKLADIGDAYPSLDALLDDLGVIRVHGDDNFEIHGPITGDQARTIRQIAQHASTVFVDYVHDGEIHSQEINRGSDLFRYINQIVGERAYQAAGKPFFSLADSRLSQRDVAQLRRIVQRVSGLTDAQFEERIVVSGLPRWGKGFTEASGFYDPVPDAVTLSLAAADTGTAYHEAFHRLQAAFLTDQERAVLANETERLRQIVRLGSPFANMADTMEQVELEAEAFAVWSRQMDQDSAAGLRLHIAIRRAWQRLRSAVESVGNYLRGRGFNSLESVYGAAYAGRTAQRPRRVDARREPGLSVPAKSVRLASGVNPLDPRMQIRAYHGSPHDFDQFDIKRIGTGQGAQTYGMGLYFAENKDVAAHYRRTLTPIRLTKEVKDALQKLDYLGFDTAREAAEAVRSHTDWRERWDIQASDAQWADIVDQWSATDLGQTYEVRINATPDQFLDWDAPLSAQPKAHEALLAGYRQPDFEQARQEQWRRPSWGDGDPNVRYADAVKGGTAYRALAGDQGSWDKANKALMASGIVGIRYRDEGSRALKAEKEGEATYNYVLFDDSLIEIERKYQPAIPPDTDPRDVRNVSLTRRIADALNRGTAQFKGMEGGLDRRTRGDAEELGDFAHRKLIDYLHPLYLMQKGKESDLKSLNNSYQEARLAEDIALAAIQTKHDMYVTPAIEEMVAGQVTIEDLHRYLYALHAEERNRVVGLRNPEDSDLRKAVTDTSIVGASGMSTDEARSILSDQRQDTPRFRALKRAGEHVRAMLDISLKEDRAAGLVSRETYELLSRQWKNYVPLKGMDGQDDLGNWRPMSRGGFDVRGDEFKTALGRFSEADNILANAVHQMETSLLRQKKNDVGKTMLRFINQFDPKGEAIAQVYWSDSEALGDISKAEPLYKRVIGADGEVKWRKATNPFTSGDDVLATKVGGKTYYIRFRDPKVGYAVRKLGMPQIAGITKLVRHVTVWQSIVNTRANPAFTPINVIRDVQTGATHLLDEGFTAGEIGQVVGNIPKAWKALWRLSTKQEPKSEWDRWAREYFDSGGKITFHGYSTMESQLRKLESDMRSAMGKENVPVDAFKRVWRFVENMNDAGENGIRLAAYVAARKKHGMDAKQAAFMARDLTVDFKKHGEWGPTINSFYVFFNAALQGNYNIARRMARSRKVQAAVSGFIFAGMMQHVWNGLMAGDNDDGENAYHSMMRNEPWKVERQFVFFLPGRTDYVSFPLPYGFNAFYHFGVQGAAMADGVKDVQTGLLDSARVWFDAFNPIGSGSVMTMASPTIADPWVELSTNTNFFGGPVYPEKIPFDQSPAPNSSRAWSSTSPIAKAIAEQVNDWTGGNAIEPGAIDIHPDTLEHLWGFAVGGLGRFFTQAQETAVRAVKGEFEPKKTPWVRSFYGRIDSDSRRTEYFQLRERVLEADGRLRDYEGSGLEADFERFQRERATDISAISVFKAAEKERRKVNKARRALEADTGLSAAERRAETERLDEIELEIMRAARQAYHQGRQGR